MPNVSALASCPPGSAGKFRRIAESSSTVQVLLSVTLLSLVKDHGIPQTNLR
jgi:hypothetical protein